MMLMMSLTICLINFALFFFIFLPVLNFNIVVVVAEAEAGGVSSQHPQQLQQQVLTNGAMSDENGAPGHGRHGTVGYGRQSQILELLLSRRGTGTENITIPSVSTKTATLQQQESNEQNVNVSPPHHHHQPQRTMGSRDSGRKLERILWPPNVGARPIIGGGGGADNDDGGMGNLIFTWDPNEFPELPFADNDNDNDNDGDKETTTIPPQQPSPSAAAVQIEPKQFGGGGGGGGQQYYYCGPRRQSNINCRRFCQSLNYPRVSCARNSCYCTW